MLSKYAVLLFKLAAMLLAGNFRNNLCVDEKQSFGLILNFISFSDGTTSPVEDSVRAPIPQTQGAYLHIYS